MCLTFFTFLMYIQRRQRPPPFPSSYWISPLCGIPRNTRECAVPSHIRVLALHLSFSSSSEQYAVASVWRKETTIFQFSMNTPRTECAVYLSQLMQAFRCDHRNAVEELGTAILNIEVSLWSILTSLLSLFYSFSQQSRISEGCSEDVNLMSWITSIVFSVSSCFMKP